MLASAKQQQQKYPHSPPAPQRPHFRRRITSELTSSSTIKIDTRVQEEGMDMVTVTDTETGMDTDMDPMDTLPKIGTTMIHPLPSNAA